MAAARCSLTHVLAVPGTPSSSRARSVASVATAISISRRWPTYLGVIDVPSRQRAAEQVGDDGPRRQAPVGRPGPVVERRQRGQLGGVLVLGVGAQRASASRGLSTIGERAPGEPDRVARCERDASERAAGNGLRGRGTQWTASIGLRAETP